MNALSTAECLFVSASAAEHSGCMCVRVRACVSARARACVCACVRACVCVSFRGFW